MKRLQLSISALLIMLMVGCTQDYSRHTEIVQLKNDLGVETAVKPLSQIGAHKVYKFSKDSKWVPGEIIVRYKDSSLESGLEVWQIRDQGADLEKISERVSRNRLVEFAEPNYIAHLSAIPNDKYFDKQWYLNNDGAPFNEESADGMIIRDGLKGADVDFLRAQEIVEKMGVVREGVVAVIDTGVDYRHLDLVDSIWSNKKEVLDGKDNDGNGYVDDVRGFNFFNSTGEEDPYGANDPMDVVGHGTHVSGIIAAMENNEEGIVGVAPQVKIMPLRAAAPSGGFPTSTYVEAILYAMKNGADVINMSFGGPFDSKTSNEAIKLARSKGVVVIAAAGNDASGSKFFPASQEEVISVAASNQRDERASFSNFGSTVDIAAPGTAILSTVPEMLGGPYDTWDGTSMASPVVAGVAGLLFATIPDVTADEVVARLLGGAENVDLDSDGSGLLLGVNRVNAARSLEFDTTTDAPLLRITSFSISEKTTKSPQLMLSSGKSYTFSVKIKNDWKGSEEGVVSLSSESKKIKISKKTAKFKPVPQGKAIESGPGLSFSVAKTVSRGGSIPITIHLKTEDGFEFDRKIRLRVGFQSMLGEFNGLSTNPIPTTIADFDNDGNEDVILSALATESEEDVAKDILVLKSDGSTLKGWPLKLNKEMVESLTGDKSLELYIFDATPPTIGDLDGDGTKEMIVPFTLMKNDGSISTNILLTFNQNGGLFGAPILSSITAPVVADIDGDSGEDILTTSLKNDGEGQSSPFLSVITGSGKKIFDLDLGHSDQMWIDDTTAVGDLDGDGKPEIVTALISEFLAGGFLFVVSSDGKILLEKKLSEAPSDIALADLDNDKELEIVLSTQKLRLIGGLRRMAGPLYAFHGDGTLVEGFPQLEPTKSKKSTSFENGNVNRLAIGDLDGDGSVEIVTSDARNELHAFHSDGSIVKGFPVKGTGQSPLFFSGAVIGDIDGDSGLEIVIGSANNTIYAYKNDGTVVPGWPIDIDYSTKYPPALGDIDGDGKTEVIATSFKSGVVVLKTPGDSKRIAWKQYRGDASHVGRSRVFTGVLSNSIDEWI